MSMPPTRRVTITELARASGVSVGTVSRALNGYADVRPETRERIMRLARELDYTPGAAARSLVTQRSHVIGVVLDTGEGHPDLQHPFFHEVMVGLKNQIGASGFDLLLFASEHPGNGYGPHSYLKRCLHHNVDGVVLMGVDADDPEVERVTRSDLAAVGVDVRLTGPATTYVVSDNEAGGERAVEHFHERGHRRIATITGAIDKLPAAERLRGYRRAIQERGLAYRDDYVAYGDFYTDSGRRAMEQLLALPEPPTAVFAASDMMALGAIRAAAGAGLSVPADISVIGFDDIPDARNTNPPLTTVRQPMEDMGRMAAHMLFEFIDDPRRDVERIELPTELIIRATCRPLNSGQ